MTEPRRQPLPDMSKTEAFRLPEGMSINASSVHRIIDQFCTATTGPYGLTLNVHYAIIDYPEIQRAIKHDKVRVTFTPRGTVTVECSYEGDRWTTEFPAEEADSDPCLYLSSTVEGSPSDTFDTVCKQLAANNATLAHAAVKQAYKAARARFEALPAKPGMNMPDGTPHSLWQNLKISQQVCRQAASTTKIVPKRATVMDQNGNFATVSVRHNRETGTVRLAPSHSAEPTTPALPAEGFTVEQTVYEGDGLTIPLNNPWHVKVFLHAANPMQGHDLTLVAHLYDGERKAESTHAFIDILGPSRYVEHSSQKRLGYHDADALQEILYKNIKNLIAGHNIINRTRYRPRREILDKWGRAADQIGSR